MSEEYVRCQIFKHHQKIIHDYENKIKELQEENEQLQKDCDNFKMNGGYLNENCANYMASKLKDDLIIMLREENEKLKEQINTLS